MMIHVWRLGTGLLVYVLLIFACRSQREEVAAPLPPPAPSQFSGVNWFPGHGSEATDKQSYLKAVQERAERLNQQELERAKIQRAQEKMPASRQELCQSLRIPWSAVLQTNAAKFQQLRALAAASAQGQTPCNICDGLSYMPCILCPNTDGKCVNCNGGGRTPSAEYCPACIGSGQCFLCTGAGKMLCPFCDDGMIDLRHELPQALPSIQ